MTKETIKAKLQEEWEFIQWKHEKNKGEKITDPFLKILNWIGKALFLTAMLLFVTCHYRSARVKDGPARMDIPCAILGRTQLYVANDRIYLFSESESAANVYGTDGTFLFRIQAPHFSNGMGNMVLFGEEIYISSRNHQLVRFGRDGNYLGIAESVEEHNKNGDDLRTSYDSQVYDVDGHPMFSFGLTFYTEAVYFDEEGVWYSDWVEEEKEHIIFFSNGIDTYRPEEVQDMSYNQRIQFLGGNTTAYGRSATDGKATYYVSGGGLYKTENGQPEKLAQTPLLEVYLRSPWLEWLSGFGVAALSGLVEKIYKLFRKKAADCRSKTQHTEDVRS